VKVKMIAMADIEQVDNSRNKYKPNEMTDLMASIKHDGLLQPIGLRPNKKRSGKKFTINFGNRRYRAYKMLGRKEIPSNILEAAETEADVIVTNLIENEHRSEVSDAEKGRYYQLLISDEHGLNVDQVGVRIGVSVQKVKQCIRLYSDIPEEIRKKVKTIKQGAKKNGAIPVSQADKVLTLAKKHNFKKQSKEKLFNYCTEEHVTNQHLTGVMNLMSAGATFEKAKKKVDSVKTITLQIPVKLEDWEEFVNMFGTADKVRTEMCKFFYGEDTNQMLFQKPY